MGGRLGMFDELGCMDYLGGQDGSGAASPMTMARVDDAVAAKLRDAYGRASAIILAEMDGLSALAERLVAEDTLTGAQVRDLLDGVLAAAGSPPCRG
jgi:ATP-dependent Zn protease